MLGCQWDSSRAPLGHVPKRRIDRAFRFAASSSRFLGCASVWSDSSRRADTSATSLTAASKADSLPLDGLVNPLILRTNCKEAARISSSVTGGSKLKSGLMFRHIRRDSRRLFAIRAQDQRVYQTV